MRGLVIAAGLGRRLAPVTDDAPKCLTEVNGKPILDRTIEAFRAHGVKEIGLVRGYLGHMLEDRGLVLFDNTRYRENNILASFFCAEPFFEGPLLSTYGDIVFHPDAVGALIAAPGDFVLVVDTEWRRAYEGRTLHPISEAEICRVEGGRVVGVGKGFAAEGALGEFIGLAKFSARGLARARAVYAELRQRLSDQEPFQRAPAFAKAYLTDLFLELIARGEELRAVTIAGRWCEIDTLQDLDRARRTVDW
jgi:L-glutamine-phosphate cytidylyltransferase